MSKTTVTLLAHSSEDLAHARELINQVLNMLGVLVLWDIRSTTHGPTTVLKSPHVHKKAQEHLELKEIRAQGSFKLDTSDYTQLWDALRSIPLNGVSCKVVHEQDGYMTEPYDPYNDFRN